MFVLKVMLEGRGLHFSSRPSPPPINKVTLHISVKFENLSKALSIKYGKFISLFMPTFMYRLSIYSGVYYNE
jgi:hypothetical protein